MRGGHGYNRGAGAGARPEAATAGWHDTRSQTALATQFIDDEEQYLGGVEAQRDIGRPVGRDDRELFVSCAAGEALAQQFEHLKADFIAVHDVATRSSQQLVGGIAAAAGRPLQKLLIRRQGFGTLLATLHYTELASADGSAPVRIYASECGPASAAERHAVARALLAHSRLGVIMVGELPPAALADQVQRWKTELVNGAWLNRQLLLLPLAAHPALTEQGHEMARGTPVLVRSTPKVTRAADAWSFIHASWAQLRGPLAGAAARAAAVTASSPAAAPAAAPAAPRDSDAANHANHANGSQGNAATAAARAAPTRAAPTTALPGAPGKTAASPPGSTAVAASAGDEALARYVKKVAELDGMASCCVFETASGRELAHARSDPRWVELARHGGELLAAMTTAGARLGLRNGAVSQPEAAITLGSHHHLLLRAVPHRSGLALHAVLDTSSANLTLLRLRLERLDDTMRG